MKVNVHVGWLIFSAFLLIITTYIIGKVIDEPTETVTVKNRKNYDIVSFRLPNSIDPDVFGPAYWKARHKLAEMTPCISCKAEAVSHEKFFHDYVNKKIDKKVAFPENYSKWKFKLNS